MGKGYVEATVGTIGGAALGAGAAGGATALLLRCDSGGMECLGVALLAVGLAVLGALAGALAGCYGALRLRGHDRGGRTSLILFAILPADAVALGFVSELGSGLPNPVVPALLMLVVAVAAPPLIARRLALLGQDAPGTVTV